MTCPGIDDAKRDAKRRFAALRKESVKRVLSTKEWQDLIWSMGGCDMPPSLAIAAVICDAVKAHKGWDMLWQMDKALEALQDLQSR